MKRLYLLLLVGVAIPLNAMGKRGRDDFEGNDYSSAPPIKRPVDTLAGIIRDTEEAAFLRNYTAMCFQNPNKFHEAVNTVYQAMQRGYQLSDPDTTSLWVELDIRACYPEDSNPPRTLEEDQLYRELCRIEGKTPK